MFLFLLNKMKIDYIFCRPAENFEFVSTKTVKEKRLSDHFSVISEVIMR